MVIALLVRIAVSYVAVLGQGFSTKEKLFVALSWLPKATVQVSLNQPLLVGLLNYCTSLLLCVDRQLLDLLLTTQHWNETIARRKSNWEGQC